MDIPALRALLKPALIGLARPLNHRLLTEICENLGLHPPSRDEASPAGRMEAAWNQLSDQDVVSVAHNFLERYCREDPALRNRLEDILFASDSVPTLHRRLRHELAQALRDEPLFGDSNAFRTLLDKIWILDAPSIQYHDKLSGKTLGERVERHLFKHTEDWDAEMLLDNLGAFDATDWRFGRFLEGMVSGEVWRSTSCQQAFAAKINAVLVPEGLELRETAIHEGYPIYTLVGRLSGHRSRPKNLIFASREKPDLRLRDVISGDIEILNGEDDVLVYDRPISDKGLSLQDLKAWWADTHSSEPGKSLYRRLLQSLPVDSPPQEHLFKSYYRMHNGYTDFPALLPEVWLHWDPKTVRQRGFESMTRFRMDFLLLLPGARRIVIEVDGIHHYSENGHASPKTYAKMASADRDLRLAGYEVYRFGAIELTEAAAPALVSTFFETLFRQSGIAPA